MARKSRKNLVQIEVQNPEVVKYATWGYARISIDGERSEDSIDGQTAIIKDYVSGKPDLDLRGVVTDLGFTGRDFQRPGYTELMDGIKRGDVQCVIVKDLSRLGRSYIEVGEILFDTFPSYNVRFISVNDQYDSFADDAARKKLLILFKNLMNHMYSRDMGIKIKSSFAIKQKKGELLGSLPPYGYMFTTEGGGKHLKIEPESAKVVKLIFDLRAQGKSMIMIADYLNRNGILAPRNHYYHLGVLTNEKDAKKALWQNGYIGHLLRNEVYIGNQIQSKYNRIGKRFVEKPRNEWIIHKNAHPAIVSEEQFATVQSLLSKASEKYKKHGNKLDDNILVGKIFCTRCGKALKRLYYRKNKNEVKYRYGCRDCGAEFRHTLELKKIPCLSLEKIVGAITTTIQKNMDAFVEIDSLLDDVSKSASISHRRRSLTAKLNRHRRDIKSAEDMLAAAYTHHLAELIDSNEFNLARIKFEYDKQAAEECVERVANELTELELEETHHNLFLENFRHFRGFSELDRTIIEVLVSQIKIDPLTNEISIYLNFMEDLEKLNKLVKESGVLANVY